MVPMYQGASNICQSEGDPNGKNTLPPNHVVTQSGSHSHRTGEIMYDPHTDNQIIK